MEQIARDFIVQLASEGAKGNQDAFLLRLRKFISRIRASDPVLAELLIRTLPDAPTMREKKNANEVVPVDSDSRQKLITEEFPVLLDAIPVWPEQVTKSLNRVVLEWSEQEALRTLSLSPVRSVLFSGPPGVGKTLAAKWLASELGLSLLTLDLSTVMSSFLGKTGSNIKSVLNYAQSFPCVLLLDEFDSIAKRRDDETDVGELKRLVTVLLQAIDEWPDTSLLIAATNHEELLDPAVWRRFDLILRIEHPTVEMIANFLEAAGVPAGLGAHFAEFFLGKSFGTIEKKLLLAKKNSVLEKKTLVLALSELILDDYSTENPEKNVVNLQILKLHLEGKSTREIAKIFGTAHTTIGRAIKAFSIEKINKKIDSSWRLD
jgi:hypothetical protein